MVRSREFTEVASKKVTKRLCPTIIYKSPTKLVLAHKSPFHLGPEVKNRGGEGCRGCRSKQTVGLWATGVDLGATFNKHREPFMRGLLPTVCRCLSPFCFSKSKDQVHKKLEARQLQRARAKESVYVFICLPLAVHR